MTVRMNLSHFQAFTIRLRTKQAWDDRYKKAIEELEGQLIDLEDYFDHQFDEDTPPARGDLFHYRYTRAKLDLERAQLEMERLRFF
jgi:hypothetical protein